PVILFLNLSEAGSHSCPSFSISSSGMGRTRTVSITESEQAKCLAFNFTKCMPGLLKWMSPGVFRLDDPGSPPGKCQLNSVLDAYVPDTSKLNELFNR